MKAVVKQRLYNIETVFILITFALMSYRCYYYVGIEKYTKIMGGAVCLLLLYMLYVGLSQIGKTKYRIELLIIFCIFITSFLNILTEGTNTIPQYFPYLSFVIIFYLSKRKPSLSIVENVLVIMAIFYMICWLYQITQVPEIVFGADQVDSAGETNRGFFRFYIETKEHFPFLVFYFLAMYNREKRLYWLFFCMAAFLVVILHVTRQMIFWTFFFAVIYYFITNKTSILRIILFSLLAAIFATFIVLYIPAFSELLEMTTESSSFDNGANMDNIRFRAFTHFVTEYTNTPLSFLFGCGFPGDNTSYRSMLNRSMLHGYYLDDVGFASLYLHFGVLSIILYFILLYRILFKSNVPQTYLYLKFYIAYMIMSYLGSHSLTSNLVFVLMAIYIIKNCAIDKQKKHQTIQNIYI